MKTLDLIVSICSDLNREDMVNELISKYVVKKDGIKKPRTAYNFFCIENKDMVKETLKENEHMMTKLGALWKSTSPDERSLYQNMANMDRDRYEITLMNNRNIIV